MTRRPTPPARRRLPVGAEVQRGGTHFRVWAPIRNRVEVVLEGKSAAAFPLVRGRAGWFSGLVPRAGPGSLYRFRLDDEPGLFPDPASRFQPDGPHGPSEVVAPDRYRWRDGGWRGARLEGTVLYELHVGTFTPEGTWAAAARELPALREIGINAVEVMPVADFPGRFGWGYDGVNLFAPTRLYGRPDDFRRFVDRAHALGIAVLLDVVYNHLGPDGNHLARFAPAWFTRRHRTDWGDAINFDGPDSAGVREFYRANAAHWIAEYHLDGLRLDATQDIHDESPVHILTQVARDARRAAGKRSILLVAENEKQDVRLLRPAAGGGSGLDAIWNDDLHHSALVALTGRNEAYYSDYRGTAQELVSAAKHGFLYQGQRYRWQRKRRGTPTGGFAPARFVGYLENHDQVANSAQGLHTHQLASPACHRAMTGLLLLGPWTPLLFQGQEFASSRPFLYFADHNPHLARLVAKGRAEFLGQFPSLALPEVRDALPDPGRWETFERCRLDPAERKRNRAAIQLHRDLFALRRADPVLRAQGRHGLDGAVLGERAFVLRFRGPAPAEDRLLVVNLGRDLAFDPAPEPLLAPPEGAAWRTLWSSEDPRYGGTGTPPPDSDEGWRLPGEATVALAPRRQERARRG
jgi:maltooligosyltrehalose trehalohydrolase